MRKSIYCRVRLQRHQTFPEGLLHTASHRAALEIVLCSLNLRDSDLIQHLSVAETGNIAQAQDRKHIQNFERYICKILKTMGR
jgi:hypothetical protein